MKTLNVGEAWGVRRIPPLGAMRGVYIRFPVRAAVAALRNYRENRENGELIDNPKWPFPSAGFDELDIKSCERQHYPDFKYPDKQNRFWWRFKLKDGREIEDFYWKKDEVRGWPDKNNKNRYWFTIHHFSSDTKIEGFSYEPDKKSKDKNPYFFHFTDIDCPAIAQWMQETGLPHETIKITITHQA